MVRRSCEAGHALLIAIALIFLVGLAAQLVHDVLMDRVIEVRSEEQAVGLAAIGDAGLAATLAGLAADRSFAGLPERSFGGGSVASTVASTGPGRAVVTVGARLGNLESTVRAEVELDPSGPLVVRWERHGSGTSRRPPR